VQAGVRSGIQIPRSFFDLDERGKPWRQKARPFEARVSEEIAPLGMAASLRSFSSVAESTLSLSERGAYAYVQLGNWNYQERYLARKRSISCAHV